MGKKNHKGGKFLTKPKKSQPYTMKSSVVPHAKRKKVKPKAIEEALVKVPVVLAEEKVQIDMTTDIEFPEPVLEIKDIKKNLKVTQCRLLLPTNKLFIEGFVRKNIQYATPQQANENFVSSRLNSLTVDVPFETIAEVDFINEPQMDFKPGDKTFTYFRERELPDGFSDKEKLMSGDLSQFDKISEEKFNELPFCQLLSSKFIEYDEKLDWNMGEVFDEDGEQLDAPFEEATFTQLQEKMVIEMEVKVLQKQQVNVKDLKKTDYDF
ncbi:CsxC family protein [Texcoconibacillus texcoconensis]|uniref:DUF7852 domain-containing protein n=1 Tax=Texcoconibacillus texcoconensis TaxID=1095777 RepID=A0A840QS25_9BACI|nr:SPOCS domain-containing protein [Texcoconibacillus texcoconensis]MBB5174165.1 hypothetical protein [Texcoconibacillus texcoconensis]